MKFILLSLVLAVSLPVSAQLADHPISLSVKKKQDGTFELNLDLPQGYGFQKEAPHKILLAGKDGLEVKKADLKLQGPTHPQKLEYFEYVKPLPLALTGKGSLEVNAKLFYCNFKKNICIPAKLNQQISVP
ncbi:cell surface protein MPL17 [Leptospira ryugenii]|nr:hypothetical protein [Leptospira ryugenii]